MHYFLSLSLCLPFFHTPSCLFRWQDVCSILRWGSQHSCTEAGHPSSACLPQFSKHHTRKKNKAKTPTKEKTDLCYYSIHSRLWRVTSTSASTWLRLAKCRSGRKQWTYNLKALSDNLERKGHFLKCQVSVLKETVVEYEPALRRLEFALPIGLWCHSNLLCKNRRQCNIPDLFQQNESPWPLFLFQTHFL